MHKSIFKLIIIAICISLSAVIVGCNNNSSLSYPDAELPNVSDITSSKEETDVSETELITQLTNTDDIIITENNVIHSDETDNVIEEDTLNSGMSDETDISCPIDFDALHSVNPDIYAWLTIDGTSIDYPIVQSPFSNDYYLTHGADGNESPYGAVFSENYNSREFDDYMTVIYAHSSGVRAMFNTLIYFTDPDYFNTHRILTIYTADKTFTYKTFAAYIWDDRHILHSIDFNSAVYRSVYLNYIRDFRSMNSFISDDIIPNSSDILLTLSCCTSRDGERMLLQAVLIDEQ